MSPAFSTPAEAANPIQWRHAYTLELPAINGQSAWLIAYRDPETGAYSYDTLSNTRVVNKTELNRNERAAA